MRAIVWGLTFILSAFALSACGMLADIAGPTHSYVLAIDEDALASRNVDGAAPNALLKETVPTLAYRLAEMGVIVHAWEVKDGVLVMDVAGEDHARAIRAAIGRNVEFAIRPVDEDVSFELIEANTAPPGSELIAMADGSEILAVQKVGGITSRFVESASVYPDPSAGRSLINVTFNKKGAQKFGRLSERNVGKRLAIVINGKVVSAPIIQEPILGGMVQISGGFQANEAESLAMQLNSGELSAPLKVARVTPID
ncbi:MAG: hypothetical protein AAGL10_16375 [Pseudomonadota bacterium]